MAKQQRPTKLIFATNNGYHAADLYDARATARRLRIIRYMAVGSGQGAQTHFATRYGFKVRRWNNYEHGWPIPRDVAMQLAYRCGLGLSMDWIFAGRIDGLSQPTIDRLEAAARALDQEELLLASRPARKPRTSSRA